MPCSAHGHGTIRLHELAIPSLTERSIAALTAWYIPKSSQFKMSTRAPRGKPSSSLERAGLVPAAGPEERPSMVAL
jgi:hypothetical protein